MEQKYYTDERNVQIVISLLKAHGIRKVVASPGTTNMTFVGSIQNDPFFEIYSSVDERSAAYIACGMADESGEPVVLTCTGATASRNYMSGLTEAFYRKLPVLAITSHRGEHAIGHLLDQQIDRRQRPADIAVESVVIPLVKDATDEQFCIVETNKAILALTANGGGPVHINMYTAYSRNFSVKELPPVRVIYRHTEHTKWPEFPKGRTAIYCGVHRNFSQQETEAIDNFCSSHNAVVFTSHISGYHGKFKLNWALVMGQPQKLSELIEMDTLIQIGEIPGDTQHAFRPKQVWRVSEDGALRDMFGKLTEVFQTTEENFFKHYTSDNMKEDTSYFQACKNAYQNTLSLVPELPFGNIWIAQQLSLCLPQNSEIHFGILNSLRSWSLFELPKGIYGKCNIGGYGIDGGLSSLIGSSLCNPNKLYYGVFGDLAFFYDMNVLGNRHVRNNVRILLVNNGMGAEFTNYGHPCSIFGEEGQKYLAAAGHYGNKSHQLVKHYAEDLGYKYLTASSKEDFYNVKDTFLCPEIGSQPILLEVFTDRQNESDSLETVFNLIKRQKTVKENIKQTVKRIVGESMVEGIKKIVK